MLKQFVSPTYTEWQQTLWQDKSVDDVFTQAKQYSEHAIQ